MRACALPKHRHARSTGLTKLVSQLSREGHWAKALEVYESLDAVGVRADTTITNAAISACDKGGQWEKALQLFRCVCLGALGCVVGAALKPLCCTTAPAIDNARVSRAHAFARTHSCCAHVTHLMPPHTRRAMSFMGLERDAITYSALISSLSKV